MTYSKKEDFYWLTPDSRLFLQRGYLLPGVQAEQRVMQIAQHAEDVLVAQGFKEFSALKFYHYMSRGYYSLSSPIWANFGLDRGFPISCFGLTAQDSMQGIAEAVSEVTIETKIGGGTSGYLGLLRPRGSAITNNGESDGSFSFARLFDITTDVVSQGTSRKGMFAGYINIEHGDIHEWLNIKQPGNPIQNMFYGVCVSRQWFKEMKEGDIEKRKLWAKVLQSRKEIGIPYIFFTDNANDNKPLIYKQLGYHIYASNLCTEIMLPADDDESFVCCLSSMNVENYDEWKDTDAAQYLIYFLDAVMTDFIEKSSKVKFLEKPHKFAYNHRALGLGVLGWHTYLQNNMIPFDSFEAMQKNAEIFKGLQEKTLQASEILAEQIGQAPIFDNVSNEGPKRRNTTLMAVAPTKSSSFILGAVSQGIEPIISNYHIKDLSKIMSGWRNPALEKVLEDKGLNNEETWKSILDHDGSVQHLEELSDLEKDVFKTFSEISQLAIIQQAASRQKFIDQGQSINIMIHPDTPTKDVNSLYVLAEELGIKSLYYQNGISAAQELNRNLVNCSSCEA